MQAGNAEGKSYTSAFDGLRKIVAQEGARGLYKGIGPKLTQSVATVRFLSSFLADDQNRLSPKYTVADRDDCCDIGRAPLPCQGEDLYRHPQGMQLRFCSFPSSHHVYFLRLQHTDQVVFL